MPHLRPCHILSFTLFLALFILGNAPHAAQAKDQTQELKTIVEETINRIKHQQEMAQGKITTDGAVMVEKTGTYYAITLPHISVTNAMGIKTDIGIISLNALPGDTEDQWKATMAIPTPISSYGPDGNTISTLKIGNQYFAGLWHKKLANFLNIKARYNDISMNTMANVNAGTAQTSTQIKNISITSDVKEQSSDSWSGPFKMEIGNIETTAPGFKSNVGKISANVYTSQFSIADFSSYQDSLNALIESQKSNDPQSLSPQHVLGAYDLVFGIIGKSSNGFDSALHAENITVTIEQDENTPPFSLKLPKAALHYDTNGFKENAVKMRVALSYEGLAVMPLPPEMKEALPTSFNLAFILNKFPFQELVKMGRDTLSVTTQNPAAGQASGMQALMTLPQLLSQAQTSLTIDKSYIGNNNYRLDTEGTITANAASTHGATGTVHTTITNMESLIKLLNGTGVKNTVPNAQGALMMLSMLQMVGQRSETSDGKPVRSYDLEVTKDGKILLNGADINTVMQMGAQ